MNTATQEWIEDDLDRLEQQKERYELAMRSATTPAARERHLRNVARLDEEIAGRREALEAVARPPIVPAPAPVLVEVTGRYATLLDGDPTGSSHRAVVLAVAVAFVIGFVAVAIAT